MLKYGNFVQLTAHGYKEPRGVLLKTTGRRAEPNYWKVLWTHNPQNIVPQGWRSFKLLEAKQRKIHV